MTNLRCSVESCSHNQDNLCCLSNIKVEGDSAEMSEATMCSSFHKKSRGTKSGCGCNSSPNTSLMVDCDATKCMYNEKAKCMAAGIMVEGNHADESKETMCATFKMK